MKIMLLGFENTDDFVATFDGKPFEGRTIRLYDQKQNYGVCIGQIAAIQHYNRLPLGHLKEV